MIPSFLTYKEMHFLYWKQITLIIDSDNKHFSIIKSNTTQLLVQYRFLPNTCISLFELEILHLIGISFKL